MMSRTLSTILLIVAFGILATLDGHAQCAMCKAIAEGTTEGAGMLGGATNVGEGLNKGIIFLMFIPYILLFLLFRKRIGPFFKELNQAKG